MLLNNKKLYIKNNIYIIFVISFYIKEKNKWLKIENKAKKKII